MTVTSENCMANPILYHAWSWSGGYLRCRRCGECRAEPSPATRQCGLPGCEVIAIASYFCTAHDIDPVDYGVVQKRLVPLYATWLGMIHRCYGPMTSGYQYYGGRGISVCERWREKFHNFYSDMHPKPDQKHSLDRIDVNGDYSPENCRWADQVTQLKNRRPWERHAAQLAAIKHKGHR